MKKYLGLGLAAGLLCTAAMADNWYMSANMGMNALKTVNVAQTQTINAKFKWGYQGLVAVGYQTAPVRYELEGLYLYTKPKSTGTVGTTDYQMSGKIKTTGLMANVYYDYANDSDFTPYMGVGVGYVSVNPSITFSGVSNAIAKKKSGLGLQGILGVGYKVTPNIIFDADYRYLSALSRTFDVTNTAGTTQGVKMGLRYHTFNIGLRFLFA